MRISTRPRPAFTLIELIVALGIIALLAALTVSAVFRILDAQRETNTNIDLRKVQAATDQQVKAAMDRIRVEDPPTAVKELTRTSNYAYDNTRARALHMKLRLRQEFPQSFLEADPANFLAAYAPNPNSRERQILLQYLPKPAFSVVSGLAGSSPDEESAILLFLILGQGRGGAEFNAEGIVGVNSIPVGNKMFKVCVDHYGSPIAFRRWADLVDDPSGMGVISELSQPPFRGTGASPDPQDPDGRLGFNNWYTDNNGPYRNIALNLFICPNPAVRPTFNQNANPLDGFNRGPYVFSAGRDKVYGNENDLFGFRLQGSGKGN
jgi:prepilin-type N-terminal cleavage/methylation domain-containing protein